MHRMMVSAVVACGVASTGGVAFGAEVSDLTAGDAALGSPLGDRSVAAADGVVSADAGPGGAGIDVDERARRSRAIEAFFRADPSDSVAADTLGFQAVVAGEIAASVEAGGGAGWEAWLEPDAFEAVLATIPGPAAVMAVAFGGMAFPRRRG